jgi:class 3 adenylate cyclase/tetratricopeptide (TPR) repeat protein
VTGAARGLTDQRKLVTVVFADVVGSTAFGAANDAEAVRTVMGAYYDRMKGIAELHGGTVEKFIGDAIMVVFGIPRLHDDDGERAVRAALAMRDAMADLNRELGVSLAARIGVNSGEAVAGSGRESQFLVTGDVVNVAARLQQNAEPGEVLAGALTESLTRAAVEYAERAAIAAKGKDMPIAAHRALRPRSIVPEQARGLPAMRAQLVGRQRELRLLLDTFERVTSEQRAHLFTLVGNAGIGKSRLVGELLARIAGRGGARVLRGRVLPYGAGITYWPLMEIVREDAGITPDDGREAAIAKLDARCGERLGADAATVRQRLAVMLGLRAVDDALPEVRPDAVAREIAWAVREYVAALARHPAVVVIDDLQWAEPAVFEIIEGLTERAEDAPLLMLCVARPQLLETQAGWAAGRANAATITLDALSAEETATLIARLLDIDDLPADLRARVVKRSEGNPLFCEEFLRMLIDEGRVERLGDRWRATASAAEVRVPESIHALLGARLDGLGDDERMFMQIASIVGERFGASEVSALAPDVDVARAISALRRSGLVLEDHESRAPGRYRFKHLLMRDVAYAALSKAARAELHEAFARELEREVGDRRGEFAEIVAHHVERAFALSAEIRAPRAVLGPRARAALDHALVLAERARRRQDVGLLRPHAATVRAAVEALGDAATDVDRLSVTLLGAEELILTRVYDGARARFEEAAELAAAMSRPDLGARAHLGAAQAMVFAAATREDIAALITHTAEAERLYGQVADPGGQIESGLVALESLWARGETAALIDRGLALYERARELGDRVRELHLCARLAPAVGVMGRREEAAGFLRRTDDLVQELGARTPPWARAAKCGALRQAGELGAALRCYGEFAEIGRIEQDPQYPMAALRNSSDALLEQRRFVEAHEAARQGLELSVKLNEWWNRAELTGMLGVTTAALGDADAGLALIDALGDRSHDVYASAFLVWCRARIYEIAGRADVALDAYVKADEAIGATGFRRQLLNGLIHLDHAEFLHTLGRAEESLAHLAEAEAMLGPQSGERAERLRSLRVQITAAGSRRGG